MLKLLYALLFLLIGMFGGTVIRESQIQPPQPCALTHVNDSAYLYYCQHPEIRVLAKGLRDGNLIVKPTNKKPE